MAYEIWAHGNLWTEMEALGLGEVDGPAPGSDYRGIVLEGSIEEANVAAKAKDLPVRFEAVSS